MNKKEEVILIVDDSPENLKLLRKILSPVYSISTASSGAMAIESFNSKQPDLILLDVNMPDMDGYEVCRQIKQSMFGKDVPVIFISALQNPSDKMKAFEVGAVDYVNKPFNIEEVKSRVAAHLALNNTRQHLESLVVERTKELSEKNRQLKQEIIDRKRIEEELNEKIREYKLTISELKKSEEQLEKL